LYCGRLRRLFQQHAVGAAGLRQTLARDPLEGLDQMPDHPQLPEAETGQGRQFGAVVHHARQHRKRGLHRLDEIG
jgi:hypothetical protein